MWFLKARKESFPSGLGGKCVSRRQDILQGHFTKLKWAPASKAVEGNWNTEQWVEIATVHHALFSENKYQRSAKRMQGNSQHEPHWLLTEGELREFQTEI
jgi:hypothetical protein